MDKFCQDHGFAGWFETSAKDNVGKTFFAEHQILNSKKMYHE